MLHEREVLGAQVAVQVVLEHFAVLRRGNHVGQRQVLQRLLGILRFIKVRHSLSAALTDSFLFAMTDERMWPRTRDSSISSCADVDCMVTTRQLSSKDSGTNAQGG